MQLSTVATLRACPVAAPRARRTAVVASAVPQPEEAVSRRSALAGLAALPALVAAAPALAFGKDPKQAQREKEARRQKLKESAAKMKTSQKSDSAFADSKYGLPEESTTPRGMRASGE